MASYEREFFEFVQDFLINSAEVAALFNIPSLTATQKYIVLCSIDEKNPPSFFEDEENLLNSRAIIVLWALLQKTAEDKKYLEYSFILSVGHRDEAYIELAGGSRQQRGKMNNADIAEQLGALICDQLQKKWKYPTICSFELSQILSSVFPNFLHGLKIGIKNKKSHRKPLY